MGTPGPKANRAPPHGGRLVHAGDERTHMLVTWGSQGGLTGRMGSPGCCCIYVPVAQPLVRRFQDLRVPTPIPGSPGCWWKAQQGRASPWATAQEPEVILDA